MERLFPAKDGRNLFGKFSASGFEVPKTDHPLNDAVLPLDRNRPLQCFADFAPFEGSALVKRRHMTVSVVS
jgi:hypothetical protein